MTILLAFFLLQSSYIVLPKIKLTPNYILFFGAIALNQNLSSKKINK